MPKKMRLKVNKDAAQWVKWNRYETPPLARAITTGDLVPSYGPFVHYFSMDFGKEVNPMLKDRYLVLFEDEYGDDTYEEFEDLTSVREFIAERIDDDDYEEDDFEVIQVGREFNITASSTKKTKVELAVK